MTADIVDRISELVDEQLAAGEPCNGYDFGDPGHPRCPHCGRHWHGLRITERIAHMYSLGVWDPEYSAAADDSNVVCEGSTFIGPRRAPAILAPTPGDPREIAFRIIIAVDTSGWRDAMRRFREALEQMGATLIESAREWTAIVGGWEIPDNLFDASKWYEPPSTTCTTSELPVTFGPQNWIHELMRYHPALQFPRHVDWFPAPLDRAVSALWSEFREIEMHIPPRPGYDFTAYATEDVQHGPARRRDDQHAASRHMPPATARRRKARARG